VRGNGHNIFVFGYEQTVTFLWLRVHGTIQARFIVGVSSLHSCGLAQLVTAWLMQRTAKRVFTGQIILRSVFAPLLHMRTAHVSNCAYNGGILFWRVALNSACAERVILTSLLAGPHSVRSQVI
jgi:hypothetical protein